MQQEVSVMTMVVNLTIVRKMRYLILITVIIACFPAYGQRHDFQIRGFDKSLRSNKDVTSELIINDSNYFEMSYQLSYKYVFKHQNYKFGQNGDIIVGDAAVDVVRYNKKPIFAIKKHVIFESTHYYERDTLYQLIKQLPKESHKNETLRYGLVLDFYYLKDSKGNWNCIIPNGESIWMYTFKKSRNSKLYRLHKEFFGILAENCGG